MVLTPMKRRNSATAKAKPNAKPNLDKNMKEVADGKVNPFQLHMRYIPPLCLWLEELGPAFGMPLKGDAFQLYSFEEEYMTAILQKDNAAKVGKTLVDVQTKLAELKPMIDFGGLEVVCQDSNTIPGDVAQKLKLWKALACSGCRWQEMLSYVQDLQEAWNAATWESSCNVFTRRLGGSYLEMGAKAMREASDTLSRSPESESSRVAEELLTEPEPEKQQQPHKRFDEIFRGFCAVKQDKGSIKGNDKEANNKEEMLMTGMCFWDKLSVADQRKRYNESVKCYSSALEGVVSTTREKPTMEEVTQMQVEVRSGWKSMEKLLAELQFKLQVEWVEEEKPKLEKELSRLKVEKEKIEADAEAERARFAGERVRFEAEKAKLDAKRAAVEAAAQVKLDEERTQTEATRQKLEYEKNRANAEAAARVEAQTCQICCENPHNVIIFPCAHAHYCEECVERSRSTNNTCPTCRTRITGTMLYKA